MDKNYNSFYDKSNVVIIDHKNNKTYKCDCDCDMGFENIEYILFDDHLNKRSSLFCLNSFKIILSDSNENMYLESKNNYLKDPYTEKMGFLW